MQNLTAAELFVIVTGVNLSTVAFLGIYAYSLLHIRKHGITAHNVIYFATAKLFYLKNSLFTISTACGIPRSRPSSARCRHPDRHSD